MHRSTMLGSQLVGDLVEFMVTNGIRKQVIPHVEMPVNLHSFPIEVARFSKVLKVIQTLADAGEPDADTYSFNLLDQRHDRFHRVTFSLDRVTRAMTVTVDPESP